MALRVSISPTVAEAEDHNAKSRESQATPVPVVCCSTCRTSLEAAEGRTSPTCFIRMPCEPGAEPIIAAMPVTDTSMGKKPSRNQKANSAARFMIFALTAPRHVARNNSRQLKPASLRTAAIWIPHKIICLTNPASRASEWWRAVVWALHRYCTTSGSKLRTVTCYRLVTECGIVR